VIVWVPAGTFLRVAEVVFPVPEPSSSIVALLGLDDTDIVPVVAAVTDAVSSERTIHISRIRPYSLFVSVFMVVRLP
jgi:hypothetical protein